MSFVTIQLPLVLVGGLLGSSHCLGMCGPFALLIGSGAPSWRGNVARQLVYGAGRVFTYGTLGALAGFGGLRLVQLAPAAASVPAALAVCAGALLMYQGLAAAGVLRRFGWGGSQPCLGAAGLAALLRDPRWLSVFLAGVFTGFLPCGLVYGFLALAAATASVPHGALLMAAFGLGTTPLMTLAGVGGQLLTVAARRRMFQVAAWCVVVAGAVSIARGVGYLPWPGVSEVMQGCPLCE